MEGKCGSGRSVGGGGGGDEKWRENKRTEVKTRERRRR